MFTEALPIGKNQLYKLRNLRDTHGHQMVDNFRPVLPLNDRRLYVSVENFNM